MAVIEQNFSPWTTDAKELLRGGSLLVKSKAWIRDLYLVECEGIKAYRAGTPIVASMRGNGKSAVVNRQAVILLDNSDRQRAYLPLLEHSPFVSELTGSKIRVPAKALDRLTSTPRWAAIWNCTLMAHVACMVLRGRSMPPKPATITRLRESSGKDGHQAGLRDPDEDMKVWIAQELSLHRLSLSDSNFSVRDFLFEVLDMMRGHTDSLAPAASYLIEAGLETDNLKAISEALMRVGKLVEPEQVYAIHADAVDEALGTEQEIRLMDACRPNDDDGSGKMKDSDYPETVARRVWLASQKGFLVATHRISSALPYVRIFGSIRIEPIKNLDKKDLDLLGTNHSKILGSLYCELIYTASQLKEIFALNVARTDVEALAKQDDADPQTRLFGFRDLSHSRVYGTRENILDLMLRHTFGSARDLVLIAKNAKDSVTASQRNTPVGIDAILKSIDSSGALLCADWMNDVVPGFPAQLELATRKLQKNIFSISEVDAIETAIVYPGMFAELFSRGLLGYPFFAESQRQWCMEFKSPDGNDHSLPLGVPYFSLHPALSAWVCAKSADKSLKQRFYTGEFIVGHGVSCPPELVQPRVRINVEATGDWFVQVFNHDTQNWCAKLSSNETEGKLTALVTRRLRLLLLPLILMQWRDRSKVGFYMHDFLNETQWLRDIGLLRSSDDEKKFDREVKRLFADKPEAQQGMNDASRYMDIAMHFETTEESTASAVRGCRLEWRNGSSGYRHWIPVDGREIEVSVKQSRLPVPEYQ